MSIYDVVRALPRRHNDWLNGYRSSRTPSHPIASSIGLLGLGMAVGAGMALLYAPEPGHKLRRRLAERFEEAVHHVGAGREDGSAARESAH